MSECEMPKGGGLQINRKMGQSIHVFVAGVEVRIEIRQIKGTSVKLAVIADPNQCAIRRGEQMESPWQE